MGEATSSGAKHQVHKLQRLPLSMFMKVWPTSLQNLAFLAAAGVITTFHWLAGMSDECTAMTDARSSNRSSGHPQTASKRSPEAKCGGSQACCLFLCLA